ncbi:hypothetical protein PPUJ20005_21720 [Pseudomonas putida]|nr:hypothetical protein PPUJ20005_21720 [Pseudomonas putida]
MGATLKRRDGSGRVVSGFGANSRGILVYAFWYHFSGFWALFGCALVRCTNANHACTTENHGNYQSKEKGCWDGELYRPDLPQEKGVLVYQEAQTFAREQLAQV